MKHEFDYTFVITVKDQFGMDVFSANDNIDNMSLVIQEMDDTIEQYDKDLGYVADGLTPSISEEDKEENQEWPKQPEPVLPHSYVPKRDGIITQRYERKQPTKAKAK